MNIFIGSLPYSLSESELKAFFEEYGEVSSVKIITDKLSGRSKGFGFVEMSDDEHAKKAIEELHGAEINGRAIVVNQAEERRENNDRSRNTNFRSNNNRPGGGDYNRNGGGGGGGGGGGYGGGGNRGGSGGGGGRNERW